MSAISEKYQQLGGGGGFLGQPVGLETACPDGVGRFRHYKGSSIYFHPATNAHEVHGAITNKWGQMGWERSVLGYPITDETKTPDGVGRFSHFQSGSLYWKPSISAHEVHGAIRQLWADGGWERNAELGYPISDELSASNGSGNRYGDFENGVLYWKKGAAKASTLSKLTLNGASRTADEVLVAIRGIMDPLLIRKFDGHQTYFKMLPALAGPETPGGSLLNPVEVLKPVTDYSFDGTRVRNRFYKLRTVLGVEVDGSADIVITFDFRIEVFYDKAARVVKASPRSWWTHVRVPFPTSCGMSAGEVVKKLEDKVNPEMNKLHDVATVPSGINVLSVKVMPNGDLHTYIEPLG